jgi:hypothetical protein
LGFNMFQLQMCCHCGTMRKVIQSVLFSIWGFCTWNRFGELLEIALLICSLILLALVFLISHQTQP